MFDHFKAAWPTVKANLVGWIIFIVVFKLVKVFTGGLGIILLPNAYRAVRNAIVRQEGPSIGDLFNFDNFMDDLVAMLVHSATIFIGVWLCGLGAPIAVILFFWMPMLAAEGKFAAVDAAKASMAHAKGNIGAIIMFLVAAWLVVVAGTLCCYVGMFVALPVVFVGKWMFYLSQRDAILTAAEEANIPTKP